MARPKTNITEEEKNTILQLHKEKYGYLGISLRVGYSTTKIRAIFKELGLKTDNKPDVLKHEKCDSSKNIPTDSRIDMSDFTYKSLSDANKHSRILEFEKRVKLMTVRGEKKLLEVPMTIKIVAIIDNARNIKLIFTKVVGRGETKELWNNAVMEAYKLGHRVIACDTNTKFDCPIKIVHYQKDQEHPHNSDVEGVFGQFKKRIYANMDKVNNMDIDETIEYSKYIAQLQFGKKLIGCEVRQEIEIEVEQ